MTTSSKSSTNKAPTYGEVWKTLSSIDCSQQVKTKMGLSYLSWAWAWGILMEHYPEAQYEFVREVPTTAGYVEVWCEVTIGDLKRVMWLPVMDHKNNAIKDPDIRKISDTRMRCLTKCLGMFGLGHYIYAGEDLPNSAQESHEPQPESAPTKKQPQASAQVAEKAAVKEAVVDKKPSPILTQEHDIPDEESASGVVDFMIQNVDDYASDSVESLAGFWNKNKSLIDLLDTSFPSQYARLKQHFTNVKQSLI